MSNTPEFDSEQLTAARNKAWHQAGEPLLTLDAVRDWLTATGIVLFAPRSQQISAPAPSLVEATLGASSGGPTPQQIDTTRSLLARLVAEGNAIPLNLLGVQAAGAGAAAVRPDAPDFVVSPQVFSYVFTLRGDKLWKQPPSTSGSSNISTLGLRIFETLTEKGALSAAELASELGREVTEAAILRALSELWASLRVLPLLPQGASSNATLWELTSRRFTKAIKAGANAGQPTALSALISLYLAQALLATEEEVEAFLSPLAARSRIREVLHALTGSRQLETVVLEGKSLLHVPGTLPEFPAIEKPAPTEEEAAAAAAQSFEGEGRIRKFTGADSRKSLSDFKGKPAFGKPATRKPAFPKPSFGAADRTSRPASSRPFTPRADGPRAGASRFAGKSDRPASTRPDTERRPFRRDAADGAASKPSFTKPWNEDRKPRAPRAEGDAPKRPYVRRDPAAGDAPKRPYVRRDIAGKAPKRPYVRRESSEGEAPKRPYVRREGAAPSAGFAKRPYTQREGSAPSSGYAKRPYTPREGAGDDRPARPSFGAKPFGAKPFGAKRTFGDKPAFRKPAFDRSSPPDGERSAPRPRFDADGKQKPFKPFAKRDASASSDRPARPAFGAKRTFGDKPASRDFKPRTAPARDSFAKFRKPEREARPPRHEAAEAARPAYGGSDSQPRAPKCPFPRKESDLADRPVRPWPESKPREEKPRSSRPRGSFDRKPGGFSKRPSSGGFSRGPGSRPGGPARPGSSRSPSRKKPEGE